MHKFSLKGAVVSNKDYRIYEYLDIDAFCPRIIENEIEKASGKRLEIDISSPGGNVISGSEIYTMLKNYQGGVTIRIVGVAASAASVIAMAADETLISPTAQIMIHNVSTNASGNRENMEHIAEVLDGADSTIANAYVLKSGKHSAVFRELMNKETWFTPKEALEMNLVDGIMFDSESSVSTRKNSNRSPVQRATASNEKMLAKMNFNYLSLKQPK